MTYIAKASESGKVELGPLKLDFYSVRKGKIFFYVVDTTKFMYETGYSKTVSRTITKDKKISFAGYIIDLSVVNGIDNACK